MIHTGGQLSDLTAPVEGRLRGRWGFDPFEGPSAHLVPATLGSWHVGTRDANGVVLSDGAAACVVVVTVAGKPATWKSTAPDGITVTLAPEFAKAGVTIEVTQAGLPSPDRLSLAPPPSLARLSVSVVARAVRRPSGTPTAAIAIDGDEAIPSDAVLTFSLRAGAEVRFMGNETIEVATEAGATATLAAGRGLTLADSQIALATISPETDLGESAFGPLHARVVRNGVAGDWMPLGTVVRLPALKVQCPSDVAAPCALTGDRLFLLDAISAAASLDPAVAVPEGYPGTMIQVPRPPSGTPYLRLHDQSTIISRFTTGS